jgi:hypothetical protein
MDLPKFYIVGPNTLSGYQSQGAYGEWAVPDYQHPDLAPDKCLSPAKVTLWFKSWEDAQEFIKQINN